MIDRKEKRGRTIALERFAQLPFEANLARGIKTFRTRLIPVLFHWQDETLHIRTDQIRQLVSPGGCLDGPPVKQVVRHQAPGAAAAKNVREGIKDLAHRLSAMTATRLLGREQGFKNLPLGVREIR